jgi:hypothetical protein
MICPIFKEQEKKPFLLTPHDPLMFMISHSMKNIKIVKVGFCKTFVINNIINIIITPFVSCQHGWMVYVDHMYINDAFINNVNINI